MSVEWVKLGNVLEVIRGASPRPKGDPRYFGGNIPWVMISDITKEPGKYLSKTRDGVTPAGAEKSRLLSTGTLILSNSGTVCVPKILAVEGCIHDGFVAFPNLPPSIDKIYLYHYFNFIRPRIIQENKQGITQVNLNTGIVKDIDLPLRPIEEQRLVVAEIEKQFSRLDEAVASLKRIQANLKRYKAAVLKAAVEGKLTEQWRKDHPDVEPADQLLKRILAERRIKWEAEELAKMKAKGIKPKDDSWKKKYKEPAGPDTANLPQLPGGWIGVGIEQLIPAAREAMKTGPFGSLLKKHEHKTEGVPVLGIENIQAMQFVAGSKIHITTKKAEELEGYKVTAGDLIISRSGTVGEICVVPEKIGHAIISTNLMKICLLNDGMLPTYFTFLFNGSPFVLGQVSDLCKGSTRDFLNQEILKRLALVLPPLLEQKAIIREVERLFSVIEELEATIKTNLKRADRLRQTILKNVFAGTLGGGND